MAGKAFYLPMNAPPEFLGVLARALLKAPNRKLPLLPAGEASIEEAGKAKTDKGELTQYRITGLGFTPQSIWLDHEGTAASSRPGFLLCPMVWSPRSHNCERLRKKRTPPGRNALPSEFTRIPKGDLVIRNARLVRSA